MKSFDDVYNSISKETLKKLEILRKKDYNLSKFEFFLLILFILATIVNFCIGKMVFVVEGILLFVFYRISRTYSYLGFNEKYKDEIIKPIVESYNDEITYNPKGEITKEEYSETGYSTGDEYYSSDYFGTRDGKVRASDITIINESVDEDDNKRYITVFRGIFSIITLDNFSKEVITAGINFDVKNLIINGKNKIEVDSCEFEKGFDLYCKNKIYAMEIFTADLLKSIVELSKKDNTKYDFMLKGNKLYVRYYKKDIFKVDYKKSMKEESIKNVYEDTHKVLDLLTKLQQNIDEKLEYLK